MRFAFFALLGSWCALSGAEYAVLETGARIRVERHEVTGNTVKLYTAGDAFLEMPAALVTRFDPDEYVPPPPPPAPAPAAPPTAPEVASLKKPLTPQELVNRAAEQHGLPPELVHAVARAESAYRQDAISHKGAIGVMQLMPGTAASLNADPYDPEQNVEAGARYLRQLLIQYKDYPDQVKRALAAYNAGPGAVQKYNGIPPYRETQLYVHKVVERYRQSLQAKTTTE